MIGVFQVTASWLPGYSKLVHRHRSESFAHYMIPEEKISPIRMESRVVLPLLRAIPLAEKKQSKAVSIAHHALG